jgi:hypothetical protein
MSAPKKSADGENPPPRAALPKKAEAANSAPNATAESSSNALVNRASGSVKSVSHDLHPGHSVHPRGHNPDEVVHILAHIYQPWADVNSNGSGMFAVAHWAKFLEERGVSAVEGSLENSAGFLRGLTHR